ncbi:MAG: hypothetical protein HYV96_13005 [Opitutae bacterium]|nr:hypothetical protein [Opitutae bacterium]
MLRRPIHWLADAGRFVGALFLWNARKTAYVVRGRTGRCPCQNESDDSIPGRVRCDAATHWHEPARFRAVCPLLVETPDGWRCSVHASQVRPFWGRAVAWSGAALVVLFLVGAGATLVFLRAAGGAPISFTQVAWPGKWHEIRPAQSRHLFRRAVGAFAHGRLNEAHLALLSAQQRDPRNYDAALMLAQIAMFQGSVLSSDEQFERLLREHPAQSGRTAIVYHDTLLSLDRMRRLAQFSLAMAKADSDRSAVWVRSALLAVRSLSATDAVELREKTEPTIASLAPHAQLLLRAEFDARAGDTPRALKSLRAPFSGPLNPFYARHQVLRLAALGDAGAAQVMLDFYGPPFGEFEQQLTQFELSSIARDEATAEAAFRRLLAQPLQELRVERIAAALIAHPNAERYRQFSARVQREGLLEAVCDGAGLWVTGLVCDAPKDAVYWQTHGKQPMFSGYPPIKMIDFQSRALATVNSVSHLVNVLSLPREVIVALLARVEPPAPAASPAGAGRR